VRSHRVEWNFGATVGSARSGIGTSGFDGERPKIGRLSVHGLPIDGIRGSDKIASRLEAEGYQGFECAGFGTLSGKVRGWR
jgi:hypothetical protein